MSEAKCGQCLYFYAHYIPWKDDTYVEVNCGHCIYARTKHRRMNTKACVHFLGRDGAKK